MKYVVRHAKHAQIIEAESPEEAALQAARFLSVWDNVVGLELRVYPVDFEKIVLVQYENPLAEGERLPAYGRPKIVKEFIPTPERGTKIFG